MAKGTKPQHKQKPRRNYLPLLILLGLALALIALGYFRLMSQPPPQVNRTFIAIDNSTMISNPLETEEGCPLYRSDAPQLFMFQLQRKDKSENTELLYTLRYHCDCGPDCSAECGADYDDLAGSVTIPIFRFSDNDTMELLVQGQSREEFRLKCTEAQTIIYLTNEECTFTYDCYFFDRLVAERLPYEALRDYTCDAVDRTCATIIVP